ncbi:MAG TPA: amidohydrolase family protein [Spirochaetales bacterium]|nr:amidohydrolase family protein [Spirochaetales bacterium]HPD79823.1 amidohydrolase family protein [Spirochaetales bacterium]HQK33396.1 amidohydrolase family protein [Spirochaetales bacterium]
MKSKQVIELPFLHDNHSHASLYAVLASIPDISHLTRKQSMDFIMSLPADELTVIRGWRTAELSFTNQERSILPPVLLINYSLHGFFLSDKAIPIIEAQLPDVAEHADDARWQEIHVPEIFATYCAFGTASANDFKTLLATLEEQGIGSTVDMAICTPGLADIVAFSGLSDRIEFWASPDVYKAMQLQTKNLCMGIKLFLDGSIGAMSAAISDTWPNGTNGILTYTDNELEALLWELSTFNTGIAVHAIGERAIEQFLTCVKKMILQGHSFPYIQMEHVQFITEEQMEQCRDLGITLSMQPNFNEDSVIYADRLSEYHRRHNNPFRTLIDTFGFKPGKDLLFGSDGIPHSIAFALQCSLFPPYPEQELSLEEFVAGYGKAKFAHTTLCKYEIDRNANRVTMLPIHH